MKRSNSIATPDPSSRRAKRPSEIPVLPEEIWGLVFRYLKHGGEEEGRMSSASLVSKAARRLVFECATKIELDWETRVQCFPGDGIVLSPSTIFLLPEFRNATILHVLPPHPSWTQSKQEIGTYVSKLRNLTDLLVAIGIRKTKTKALSFETRVDFQATFDAIIAPSSVACPENLVSLTIRNDEYTTVLKCISYADDSRFDMKKGISVFSNLRRLRLEGGSASFLGNATGIDSESDGKDDDANADGHPIPPLSKLSTLELESVSDANALSDSWLTLTALTSLIITTEIDGAEGINAATLAPLVSLTELRISMNEDLELVPDGFASGGSLNSLTNLKTLHLMNWKISGEDISNLSGLTDLRLEGKCYEDIFNGAELEDALIELRKLALWSTRITHLPKFKNLVRLKLHNEKRLEPFWIPRLPSLVSLSLMFKTPFEKGGIEALTKLRTLKLSNTSMFAARGVTQLTNLTRLEAVGAESISLGVEEEFPNLKRFYIA